MNKGFLSLGSYDTAGGITVATDHAHTNLTTLVVDDPYNISFFELTLDAFYAHGQQAGLFNYE